MNTNQYYNPADVLIGVREPFSKNSLWIHTHDGIVEIKIFDKGWKSIFSTEDKGLSNISMKQVNLEIEELQKNTNHKLRKYLGKISSDSLTLIERYKQLEEKYNKLEERIDKLNKRLEKKNRDGK